MLITMLALCRCSYGTPPCAVAVPAARVTSARASSTAVSAGYVPDGLTAKQWEDMKKEKASKAAARKKEVASKKFEVGSLAVYFA